MPYIAPGRRACIEDDRGLIHPHEIATVGELNFAISRLMAIFASNRVTDGAKPGYSILSEAKAAANDAATEWYRRIMAPYEDKKCAENGDVYGRDFGGEA